LTSSVTWSSSDTTIATINTTGLATGVKAGGPVTIMAASGAISGTAPLTVTAGAPATITLAAGSGQSVPIDTALGTSLQVVVKDNTSTPVANVTVTFTAPSSGAGGTFPGALTSAQASTDANGVATAPTFTANGTAGAYHVTAIAGTIARPASFSLTNVDFTVVQDAATTGTIQITAGTPANIKLDVNSIPTGAPLPATVTFACGTSLPTGTSCAFNPATLAAGSPSGSSSTLTFHSTNDSGVMGWVPSMGGRGPQSQYPLRLMVTAFLTMLGIFAAGRKRLIASRRGLAYLSLLLLVVAAVNEAGRKADEAMKSSLQGVLGGLNLPGIG